MEFKLQGEYIELIKLLKICDIAQTGGHGKILITEGEVKVNGEVETRKRKKLVIGDLIEVEGVEIKICE
ncbi:MAG: RNA-binding S4 domain-containing protein [Crocinitomicaceae bacterium]